MVTLRKIGRLENVRWLVLDDDRETGLSIEPTDVRRERINKENMITFGGFLVVDRRPGAAEPLGGIEQEAPSLEAATVQATAVLAGALRERPSDASVETAAPRGGF